jgi:endonuclease YncB( thermonuclease family)/quercetin dioxygenase-like cupin family protein
MTRQKCDVMWGLPRARACAIEEIPMKQTTQRVVASAVLLAVGFASARLVPPQAAAQPSTEKSLAPGLVRMEDAIPTRGEWGEWRRYVRGDTHGAKDMVVLAVTLKPGQAPHPPHRHAEEELMILAEGTGTWHLDGKDRPARKGDVAYAAPWAMHGLKNTGDAPLTYYMVKWSGKGVPAAAKPADGADEPKKRPELDVVKETVTTSNGPWTRLTGRVKVLNAYTLRFEDGTEVDLRFAVDAPEPEQKGRIGDMLYPCGKEAAEFLANLIGDKPVSFFTDGQLVPGKRARGPCYVGETHLQAEMVRSGWAVSQHSGMDAWEVIARENRRGLWRGDFVVPGNWRKGKRLPGEPPESEAERRAFATLTDFRPTITLDVTRPEKPVVAIEFTLNRSKVTDDDVRRLQDFPRLRGVNLRATAISDAGLQHLESLPDLVELTLDWTKVSPAAVVGLVKGRPGFRHLSVFGVPFKDRDLAELNGLTELRSLGLRGSAVTDEGLAHLKPFTRLRDLTLMSTRVGDAGLAHLKDLTELEDLDLDRTAITDAGLPHLKRLVRLRRLQMAHTAVTDAGLDSLLGLVELQGLNLRGTAVTRAGAEKITSRLPGTKVAYGPAPK